MSPSPLGCARRRGGSIASRGCSRREPYDEHRSPRGPHDVLGDTPEDDPRESRPAARPDHDELGLMLLDELQDRRRSVALHNRRFRTCFELRKDRCDLGARRNPKVVQQFGRQYDRRYPLRRADAREWNPLVDYVQDDELRAPQPRLDNGCLDRRQGGRREIRRKTTSPRCAEGRATSTGQCA